MSIPTLRSVRILTKPPWLNASLNMYMVAANISITDELAKEIMDQDALIVSHCAI